jgi:hypothetical protein
MKFPFARTALALAAALTLASCGGGSGKQTYPINVNVKGLVYDNLTLTTNGMELTLKPKADGTDVDGTFPNGVEYGQVYNVVPKKADLSKLPYVLGDQPRHQTCLPNRLSSNTYPDNLPYTATAGQLATIQINYVCTVNAYPLQVSVKGLTGNGLVLANGSTAQAVTPATDSAGIAKDVVVPLGSVPFGKTYGVTVLTQPATQYCSVTAGGDNGQGSGTMRDNDQPDSYNSPGVTNIVVTCGAPK